MAKTIRPMVKIHDTSTNEITEREMNDAEFEAFEAANVQQAEADALAAQKAADRAALLAQLGITEEQAKLLLG